MSHARHHGGQNHALLTLEAVFATLSFSPMPAGGADHCDPVALRPASCPVLASATVADPRTTQQVLDAVRWTLFPGSGPAASRPVLATITLDEKNPRAVTVNFLRN